MGFFFLLRPGEHTSATTGSATQPFTLADVCFRIGGHAAPALVLDTATIPFATFATLACSGNSTICPVLALTRRVLHRRQFHFRCRFFVEENIG